MGISEAEASYGRHVERYADKARAGKLTSDDREALERDRVWLNLSWEQAWAVEQKICETYLTGTHLTARTEEPPQLQAPAPIQLAQPLDTTGLEQPFEPQIEPDENATLSQPDTRLIDPQSDLDHLERVDLDPDLNVIERDPEATLAPFQSEAYFVHRQQYGQEFLQALRSEGFNLSDETRKRLDTLAIQLELSSGDVAEIQRNKLEEVYLPPRDPLGLEQPSVSFSSPSVSLAPSLEDLAEQYDSELQPLLDELEGHLSTQKFQLADQVTLQLLQKVIRPAENWFDEPTLMKFTPSSQDSNAIQEIDRLWVEGSNGKFGFSPQIQIYGFASIPSNEKDLDKERQQHRTLALAFGRSTQWWIDGLNFLKYYRQLDFTSAAPKGHLPALWFWDIPRSQSFLSGGLGLLKERGGCRLDAYTLPAFMYFLKKCGIKPR